ncbi:NAD(P)/FAD-dependent oxidoreductase [Lysobacter silvisoli]|uniref:FAD-binding oxidoreductase n=1 Tax=Lysobacter silvisoli TaxID=2293254 RepID=A0A371JXY4_9GAMM|nr:FAD-dependent oxidoreductase [Lysobacter silvisoli]RDZ26526.1 FAD-binding oxidoreductase [Lysobacter silvisoli]
MTSSSGSSVLVIGGGVIGHACALALQARGWRVRLTDPDREGIAPSWGNAGHIATEQAQPLASPATLRSAPRRLYAFGGPLDLRDPLRIAPWVLRYLRACTPGRYEHGRLALRGLLAQALPAWRRLADALQQPQLLREDGHWLCWESAASAARGRAAWAGTDIGDTRYHPLNAAHLADLRATLRAPVSGAIAFSGTAQIADPYALAAALRSRFAEGGGQRFHHRIDALQAEGDELFARTDDGQVLRADRVLVCAGVRSRALMASLGLHAPLVAERGYHLQWREHDWPQRPPLVFEDRSMIVTRFDGGLRAAGFVEYAHADSPPDPGKWRRLRQHAAELGLPVRGEPRAWFGARPTLPDYLPALGRCPRHPSLYYAFGHQHLGLTLAAVTGERMAATIDEGGEAPELAAFDLRRFAR